ncbi:MAG: HflC protein [Gammaproteobacteria bacterium]|mgnify:CR=1 FL=1|nr:HflC protein [Gammaproteobacteria bacterium]MAY03818.1 HflC protein [Gammaproteobacteria bacterium]|tara:strand:+ start:1048 stop:1923 length:876 start_codon:yes stop_codon:yes gene_type:complete
MKNSSAITLGVIAVVLIIAYNCLYVVREIDRAVLLTFGEVTNANVAPGLHFKIPGVHTARIFDGRIQTLDAQTQSYLTAEREFLEVDSYAKWKIADVSTYYTRTSGDANVANNLLSQRINTGLRNQFANRTVYEVVSGERDLLMTDLTRNLNNITLTELGIEVVDIRVKQIDLPSDVEESVYNRMNTERQQEASEARSTGRELAEIIRAEADRQATVIEANAYREAEIIRGDGDAQAAAIYSEAFEGDPEFYEFVRSLNAYRSTFNDSGDVLLLSPDSDFFKYLNNSNLPE